MAQLPADSGVTVTSASGLSSAVFIREPADFQDIIHVYGELDLANAAEFESVLYEPRDVSRGLVVDLENCQYMDLSACSVMIRAKKRLGHYFKVMVPNESCVARLLDVSQLRNVLS